MDARPGPHGEPARLVEVEQRIASLKALKAELQRMVTSSVRMAGWISVEVIEALANANADNRA